MGQQLVMLLKDLVDTLHSDWGAVTGRLNMQRSTHHFGGVQQLVMLQDHARIFITLPEYREAAGRIET